MIGNMGVAGVDVERYRLITGVRPGWLALSTLLVIVAMACLTSAQTPPPSSGDWVIDDSTTITGMTVDINGSLIVNDDGQLALANVDLSFQSVASGSVGIIVHTGGSLMINGGSVVSSNSEHYSFVVENGTFFRMENVTVSDMWHNDAYYPNDIRGGLQIFADNAWLGNCTLTGNDRVAMTIVDADPRIEDCVFERSIYHTYYKYTYHCLSIYGTT